MRPLVGRRCGLRDWSLATLVVVLLVAVGCGRAQPNALSSAARTSTPTASIPAGAPGAYGWDGVDRRMMICFALRPLHLDTSTWTFTGKSWALAETPAVVNPMAKGLLAYDSRRGREVLVVAVGGPAEVETWEWDGHAWRRVATEHSPGASQNTSAAYSPELRSVVVLDPGSMPLSPTWLYDGSDWRSVSTAHQPQALVRIEYDETRHAIAALSLDDFRTWLFDGKDWTALPLSGPTPALQQGEAASSARSSVGLRQAPAVALDEQRDLWVVFGGFDGTNSYSDTWVGGGSAWTKLLPRTAPTSRAGLPGYAYMAWDAVGHRLVMFGGEVAGWSDVLSDTWAWNGTDWTKLAG